MASIAQRTTELTLATGGKAFILPTSVKDVVTIQGSIIGGPASQKFNARAATELAASLLDAGAGNLKKNAFREGLASRGAEISFGAAGTRLSFSAQCFPEDAPYVLDRIADALFRPHLPASEIAAEKVRALADLAEEAGNTDSQALRTLARLIYTSQHPQYALSVKEEIEQVQSLTPAALRAIAEQYGTGHAAIAVVGDIEAKQIVASIEKNFGKIGTGFARPTTKTERSSTAKREDIVIKDKATIDVAMGGALGFTSDDPRYLPMVVLNYALGVGLTSHLMQTVRERDGLTYDIRSRLVGFADGLDGYFRTTASFAPPALLRGMEGMKYEINEFLKKGIDEERLAQVKDEIAGSYAVSLSTTGGLARHLIRFAEEEHPLLWIDEYPNIVRAVSHKQVQDAAENLRSLPLSIATAGSMP